MSVMDKWGCAQTLTVLHVDRNQVVENLTMEEHGVDGILIGGGQRGFLKIKPHEFRKYVKAHVPPKKDLVKFKIDPLNQLPVGYMLGPRHFTIG